MLRRQFTSLASLLATLLVWPARVSATAFENPIRYTGSGAIVNIILNIIRWLLSLAGPLALLAVVYGALLLTVGGIDNEQTAARGKKVIFWGVVGLAIVGLSFVILSILTVNII